jgi:hypothetical protein
MPNIAYTKKNYQELFLNIWIPSPIFYRIV